MPDENELAIATQSRRRIGLCLIGLVAVGLLAGWLVWRMVVPESISADELVRRMASARAAGISPAGQGGGHVVHMVARRRVEGFVVQLASAMASASRPAPEGSGQKRGAFDYHRVPEVMIEALHVWRGMTSRNTTTTTEIWTDSMRKAQRTNSSAGQASGVLYESITVDGVTYQTGQSRANPIAVPDRWFTSPRNPASAEALAANGVQAALGDGARLTTAICKGRAAYVVTGNAILDSSDARTYSRYRICIDARTYTILAVDTNDRMDAGIVFTYRTTTTFTTQLVPRSQLTADFFDPATIGYKAPQPADAVARLTGSMPVYWIGEQFAGEPPDLPALVLRDASTTGRGGSADVVTLEYAEADAPAYRQSVVAIKTGAQAPYGFWTGPCWRSETRLIGGREATIYSGYDKEAVERVRAQGTAVSGCPADPPDSFLAHVDVGSGLVMIDFREICDRPGDCVPSAYDSEAGVLAIVKELTERRLELAPRLRPSP